MIGIPFTIRRTDSEQGIVETVVYLRSRRRGAEGEKMRKAIRDYNRTQFEQSRNVSRAAAAVARMHILGEGAGEEALEKVLADQEAAMDASETAREQQLARAEEITALSLADNYGPEEAQRLLDVMTDEELCAVVQTIEHGAMPPDFFRSRGTPPKQNSTQQDGDGPSASSSPRDIQEGTSKEAT